MKWRQSVIYLVILLLVGGYYYYFEVIVKDREHKAETAAKKVFRLQQDQVQAVEINEKGKQSVLLEKESAWKIKEPLQTEADINSVEDLLKAASDLKSVREVEAEPKDLQPFGLKDPALKFRLRAGDQWTELLLGDKTPVGDARYAKLPDKASVFLVSGEDWTKLDKGLDDLRKRDLCRFQPDEIKSVRIAWKEGQSIDLERQDDGKSWKAQSSPDTKIKNDKVDNFFEQLQWLKAKDFLQEPAANAANRGLEPPQVVISMKTKKDQDIELRVGQKQADPKLLAASSSQLSGLVEVDSNILAEIPKDAAVLENRSLLDFNTEETTKVTWQVGEARGEAIRLDAKSWQVKIGDGAAKELKEPWKAKSLLWDLRDTEYLVKVQAPSPAPEKPYAHLEFYNGDKKMSSLSWDKPTETGGGTATIWIGKEGGAEPVVADLKALQTALKDIEQLTSAEKL